MIKRDSLSDRMKNIFFKDPVPFSNRREVNWRAVKLTGIGVTVAAVLALLFLPTSPPEMTSYHEMAEPGSTQMKTAEANPSEVALSQFKQSRASLGSVHQDLGYLYRGSGGGTGAGGGGSGPDRKSSMIITRGGLDSKTQLPPGSRLRVRLTESVVVEGQGMPVIGVVSADFIHEDGLAIPRGARLFGEVSFDGDERANVLWRAVQMPDGRERPLSATSVSLDGKFGVEGKIHSNGVKNTIGQTLTRFIGAYAEGSMERGAFGGNPGGRDNGYKNAISETAKDRAEAWSEDLKKEKRWIELSNRTEFYAVLKESFTFRDPGGSFR